MMGGWGMAWMFPVVGMILVITMVGIGVARMSHGSLKGSTTSSSTDPLFLARERYARGQISHQEFERIIEGLLRTER